MISATITNTNCVHPSNWVHVGTFVTGRAPAKCKKCIERHEVCVCRAFGKNNQKSISIITNELILKFDRVEKKPLDSKLSIPIAYQYDAKKVTCLFKLIEKGHMWSFEELSLLLDPVKPTELFSAKFLKYAELELGIGIWNIKAAVASLLQKYLAELAFRDPGEQHIEWSIEGIYDYLPLDTAFYFRTALSRNLHSLRIITVFNEYLRFLTNYRDTTFKNESLERLLNTVKADKNVEEIIQLIEGNITPKDI